MTVYVFVSATCKDLSQDCRPCAINAVHLSDAVPVTMETWDTEYLDPVELCRRKIEQDSSHYLGIYAYRYGWIPDKLGKSITEAEFDWVLDCKKPMVVFLPNPTTEFATELKRRAADQCPSDETAQLAFLARVSSKGTYQPFNDATDLSARVTRRVIIWAQGGLRGIASQAKSFQTARSASKVRPSESDIVQLGRKPLSRQFEDSLEVPQNLEQAAVVCFLIHGASGYGHKEMVVRLRQILEQQSSVQPRRYEAGFSPLWREKSLAKLLELIGDQIEQGWIPDSPEVLAQRLQKMLETSDVILQITEIQRFNGSLLSFIKDFWHLTVSVLKKPTQHQLVVLLTLEQTILPEWEAFVQSPPRMDDGLDIDPMRPIKLAELKEFTEKELTSWLYKWLSPNDASVLAKTLMDETKGNPQSLYNKLRDDSTWVG